MYASSSSVYGANHTLPYSEDQNVDHPMSLYAATKKADELIAHSYSHLYRLPSTTGLRFFTVYGPWGRPDMAAALFTRAIVDGTPIKVFNFGRMRRDFTYIDDIVEGVVRVLSHAPEAPDAGVAPYAIYNIGNHTAIDLESFIGELERLLGKRAIREYLPPQPGDVPATFAAIDRIATATGFAPRRLSLKDCGASWRGISTTIAPTDPLARHDRIRAPGEHLARLPGAWSSHDSGHRRSRIYRRQFCARLARRGRGARRQHRQADLRRQSRQSGRARRTTPATISCAPTSAIARP